MRWLVDGMNVIGSRPDGWWRDRPAARARLVAELAELIGRPGPEPPSVTVVFDGKRPAAGGDPGGLGWRLEVLYAPGGPDAADRVIAEMARSLEDPGSTTVVTSDAALAAQVRAAGVSVVGAGAFRAILEGPAP